MKRCILAAVTAALATLFGAPFYRPPDLVVGERNNPYMHRWHIVKVGMLPRVYIHKFMRSDDDRALHDHPWAYLSILLRGRYFEVTDDDCLERKPGSVVRRSITHRHRVMLEPAFITRRVLIPRVTGGSHVGVSQSRSGYKPCWTLFITGPERRRWGFWCNGDTFVPAHQFDGCDI